MIFVFHIVWPLESIAETQPQLQPALLRSSATISPMLHRVASTLTRNSAQRLCKCRRFDCTINLCSEQSAYGNGAGVAAARGHLDVPVIVALEPSVVSDFGLRASSGVGVGVASDFGLAPCLAPWLAPCPAPFECPAREGCLVCALKLLSAPCL